MIRFRIGQLRDVVVEVEHLRVVKIESDDPDVRRLAKEFVRHAVLLGEPPVHHDRDILLWDQIKKMGRTTLLEHTPPELPTGEIN